MDLPANAGDSGSILGREDPLEKEMATHSSNLAKKPHGQRSLVGYSSWGHKVSGMTERLNTIPTHKGWKMERQFEASCSYV